MNTMKKVMAVAVIGMVMFGMRKAEAASTDTIQLLVTPGVTYSVSITSADTGIAYNFGTVDLNMTTLSERPAIVTNNGNIVSEWQVSAVGEDTWTLANATGLQNETVLKALFNSRLGAQPTAANFNTLNGSTLSIAAKNAENTSLSTNNAIVTLIPINAQRDLYFMMHTPVYSTVGTQQRFRVYVTAVAP